MAEWRGGSLQNFLRRFESAINLMETIIINQKQKTIQIKVERLLSEFFFELLAQTYVHNTNPIHLFTLQVKKGLFWFDVISFYLVSSTVEGYHYDLMAISANKYPDRKDKGILFKPYHHTMLPLYRSSRLKMGIADKVGEITRNTSIKFDVKAEDKYVETLIVTTKETFEHELGIEEDYEVTKCLYQVVEPGHDFAFRKKRLQINKQTKDVQLPYLYLDFKYNVIL